MRALILSLALLAAGFAGVAAADPAECAISAAIQAKTGSEALAFGAMNAGLGDASSAVTQVTLDVPPSGPLNPATPGDVVAHAQSFAEGAQALGASVADAAAC